MQIYLITKMQNFFHQISISKKWTNHLCCTFVKDNQSGGVFCFCKPNPCETKKDQKSAQNYFPSLFNLKGSGLCAGKKSFMLTGAGSGLKTYMQPLHSALPGSSPPSTQRRFHFCLNRHTKKWIRSEILRIWIKVTENRNIVIQKQANSHCFCCKFCFRRSELPDLTILSPKKQQKSTPVHQNPPDSQSLRQTKDGLSE